MGFLWFSYGFPMKTSIFMAIDLSKKLILQGQIYGELGDSINSSAPLSQPSWRTHERTNGRRSGRICLGTGGWTTQQLASGWMIMPNRIEKQKEKHQIVTYWKWFKVHLWFLVTSLCLHILPFKWPTDSFVHRACWGSIGLVWKCSLVTNSRFLWRNKHPLTTLLHLTTMM